MACCIKAFHHDFETEWPRILSTVPSRTPAPVLALVYAYATTPCRSFYTQILLVRPRVGSTHAGWGRKLPGLEAQVAKKFMDQWTSGADLCEIQHRLHREALSLDLQYILISLGKTLDA